MAHTSETMSKETVSHFLSEPCTPAFHLPQLVDLVPIPVIESVKTVRRVNLRRPEVSLKCGRSEDGRIESKVM